MPDIDTHFFIVPKNGYTSKGKKFDGRGYDEAFKISNKKNVSVINATMFGGSEDCLDMVRGSSLYIKGGSYDSDNSQQAFTIKGAVDGIHIEDVAFNGTPKNGHIVLGQYTDYDFHGLPKTKRITIKDCVFPKGRPSVVLWNAEEPIVENCENYRCKKIPKFIVWAYFTFRKIQDRIRYGKEGKQN
jgi:hypothetical protein